MQGEPALHIEMHFRGTQNGETTIELPHEWQGEVGLENGIRNLRVDSKDASLRDAHTPYERLIADRPGVPVAISYDLVESEPASQDQYPGYRPLIEPEFFHFVGTGAWVLPKWPRGDRISVTINWNGFPAEWPIANSFAVNQRQQRFEATLSELQNAVFGGGSFRLRSVRIGAEPVTFALHGEWTFTDDQFTDVLSKIVRVERDFWRDHNFPLFSDCPHRDAAAWRRRDLRRGNRFIAFIGRIR